MCGVWNYWNKTYSVLQFSSKPIALNKHWKIAMQLVVFDQKKFVVKSSTNFFPNLKIPIIKKKLEQLEMAHPNLYFAGF